MVVTPGCEGSLQQEWFGLLVVLSVPAYLDLANKIVGFFLLVFQHYLVGRSGRAFHCQQPAGSCLCPADPYH